MRKLCVALLAAALLFPIVVAPVAATHSTNCGDAGSDSRVTGERLSGISSKIDGVVGYVKVLGYPETCTDNGTDLHSMTSIWVGIQPNSGAGLSIVQVGLMKCAGAGTGYPQGRDSCETDIDNTWRYFYAFGGCNGNVPWPRDLGPVPAADFGAQIKLRITHVSTGSVSFSINNVTVATAPYSSAMGCWSNSLDFGVAACETWDRGDSCGGFASGIVKMEGLSQRRDSDQVWITSGQVTDPCWSIPLTRYKCDPSYLPTNGGNIVDLWTVQP